MDQKMSFGESLADIQYQIIQGVYAVILNKENTSVAVVKTSAGIFLPGGGIENGENHDECLKRECLEEIGFEINIGDFVGRAERYFYSPTQRRHMVSDGFFYTANLTESVEVQTEVGHEFLWIPEEDILKSLYHEHQVWAVQQVVSL